MPPLSTANKGSARGQQTLKRPQSARARPKPEWNNNIVDDSEYKLKPEQQLGKQLQLAPRQRLQELLEAAMHSNPRSTATASTRTMSSTAPPGALPPAPSTRHLRSSSVDRSFDMGKRPASAASGSRRTPRGTQESTAGSHGVNTSGRGRRGLNVSTSHDTETTLSEVDIIQKAMAAQPQHPLTAANDKLFLPSGRALHSSELRLVESDGDYDDSAANAPPFTKEDKEKLAALRKALKEKAQIRDNLLATKGIVFKGEKSTSGLGGGRGGGGGGGGNWQGALPGSNLINSDDDEEEEEDGAVEEEVVLDERMYQRITNLPSSASVQAAMMQSASINASITNDPLLTGAASTSLSAPRPRSGHSTLPHVSHTTNPNISTTTATNAAPHLTASPQRYSQQLPLSHQPSHPQAHVAVASSTAMPSSSFATTVQSPKRTTSSSHLPYPQQQQQQQQQYQRHLQQQQRQQQQPQYNLDSSFHDSMENTSGVSRMLNGLMHRLKSVEDKLEFGGVNTNGSGFASLPAAIALELAEMKRQSIEHSRRLDESANFERAATAAVQRLSEQLAALATHVKEAALDVVALREMLEQQGKAKEVENAQRKREKELEEEKEVERETKFKELRSTDAEIMNHVRRLEQQLLLMADDAGKGVPPLSKGPYVIRGNKTSNLNGSKNSGGSGGEGSTQWDDSDRGSDYEGVSNVIKGRHFPPRPTVARVLDLQNGSHKGNDANYTATNVGSGSEAKVDRVTMPGFSPGMYVSMGQSHASQSNQPVVGNDGVRDKPPPSYHSQHGVFDRGTQDQGTHALPHNPSRTNQFVEEERAPQFISLRDDASNKSHPHATHPHPTHHSTLPSNPDPTVPVLVDDSFVSSRRLSMAQRLSLGVVKNEGHVSGHTSGDDGNETGKQSRHHQPPRNTKRPSSLQNTPVKDKKPPVPSTRGHPSGNLNTSGTSNASTATNPYRVRGSTPVSSAHSSPARPSSITRPQYKQQQQQQQQHDQTPRSQPQSLEDYTEIRHGQHTGGTAFEIPIRRPLDKYSTHKQKGSGGNEGANDSGAGAGAGSSSGSSSSSVGGLPTGRRVPSAVGEGKLVVPAAPAWTIGMHRNVELQ